MRAQAKNIMKMIHFEENILILLPLKIILNSNTKLEDLF